jgi:hypothetical protein
MFVLEGVLTFLKQTVCGGYYYTIFALWTTIKGGVFTFSDITGCVISPESDARVLNCKVGHSTVGDDSLSMVIAYTDVFRSNVNNVFVNCSTLHRCFIKNSIVRMTEMVFCDVIGSKILQSEIRSCVLVGCEISPGCKISNCTLVGCTFQPSRDPCDPCKPRPLPQPPSVLPLQDHLQQSLQHKFRSCLAAE